MTALSFHAVANEPNIYGTWQLDEASSEDFEKELEGMARRYSAGFRQGGLDTRATQYKQRERARRGTFSAVRVVANAPTLTIDGAEGVSIAYGDGLKRTLRPNPNGKVYSASGEELVVDDYGRTLSYWYRSTLVIETTNDDGMKLEERYYYDQKNERLRQSISVKPRGEARLQLVRQFVR